MTRIYFVRHAQPEHNYADDRTRPLTPEGIVDAKIVLELLKDKKIDEFYCSPYLRSISTIKETADFYKKRIHIDERLRERENGPGGNNLLQFQKRWAEHSYHEVGGESISMVQKRNVEALKEILANGADKDIVVGTHGTALSAILNYYQPDFECNDFLRIIDWMPYLVEMDFDGQKLLDVKELGHIAKIFKA